MAPGHEPREPQRDRRTPFGEWFTKCRLDKGLRQSQVAAFLDVNQGRITEWEQGIALPPDDIRQKLAELFGEAPPPV
jgi:transcriptional regulator with XRE-family HTH domain